jgi:hypothetical protein
MTQDPRLTTPDPRLVTSHFPCRFERRGIDRKLGILRDTYSMLNAESPAARGEVMELAILLLILGEILLMIFGRR